MGRLERGMHRLPPPSLLLLLRDAPAPRVSPRFSHPQKGKRTLISSGNAPLVEGRGEKGRRKEGTRDGEKGRVEEEKRGRSELKVGRLRRFIFSLSSPAASFLPSFSFLSFLFSPSIDGLFRSSSSCCSADDAPYARDDAFRARPPQARDREHEDRRSSRGKEPAPNVDAVSGSGVGQPFLEGQRPASPRRPLRRCCRGRSRKEAQAQGKVSWRERKREKTKSASG